MSAYEKGREAFKNGEKRTRNPYNRGKPQFVAWIKGWRYEEALAYREKYGENG